MSGWFTLLPGISAEAVGCLWRAAWQGSIGFLIVWLICGLVPRMPARFQCWLWRLALLKFMVVLLWRVPLAVPLLPAVIAPPSNITMSPVTISTVPSVIDAISISSASNMADSQTIDPLAMLLTVLFLAWLVGVAWQAIRLARGWMAMRRFRRRCRTLCSDELTRHLRTLCKAYGVRRLPLLLEHEGTGSPLLLGILRPAIVMPSALLSAFGSEQYRMALAHELAHIKRHDLAWNLVAALVRMVFVFHPLVWWSSWRLDVSQEIAADEFVLRGSGKEFHSCTYAEMLLVVANQPQPNGIVPALSVGTIGRYQTLKRRIAAMKSFYPTSRGVVAASIIMVLLVASVGVVPWRLVAAEAQQRAETPQAVGSLAWRTDNSYLLPVYSPLAGEDVRKMLHLSSDQEEQLRAIAAEFSSLLETREAWHKSQSAPQGSPTKQELEFQQKAKDLSKRIEQVLSTDQLAKLKHIMVQIAAVRLVFSPAENKKLGINLAEQQQEAFARLAKEKNAALWQLRQEMREKMLAVLNPQQRKDFLAEITGVSVGPALFSGPNGHVSFAGYPDLMGADIRQQLDLSHQQQEKLDAIAEKYSDMASKELPLEVQNVLNTPARVWPEQSSSGVTARENRFRLSAGKEKEEQVAREHDIMAKMGLQMRAEIDAVLTPQQLSKFKTLSVEDRTIPWLFNPKILEKLHASEEQKKELQRLIAEYIKKLNTKASQSMRETGEKALQILDPQQRQKLDAQVNREIAACDTGMLTTVTTNTTTVVGYVGVAEKSVTVFPIVINSGAPTAGIPADMSKNMAELIGLMLERGGMKDIEIAEAKFTPPKEADLAKEAEAFAQFVKSQRIKTEYALFGQFFGTPGKGADEIRLAVVDRQGKVVLTDRLDRQQLLSHGAKKITPMLACYYTFGQLRAFWDLADAERKNAPEGKMAKLWTEKSASPPKAELEAMQPRLKALQQTIKSSTIAVFVRVSGKSDMKAAHRLATMLTRDGLGRAEAIDVGETKFFEIKPSTNQVRIIWDTARAFQKFVRTRKSSLPEDYALLADYGIGRLPDGKTVVGGVNLILCNRAGDLVLVTGRNSYQSDFQQINPHTPDDCKRLAVEVLKNNLR